MAYHVLATQAKEEHGEYLHMHTVLEIGFDNKQRAIDYCEWVSQAKRNMCVLFIVNDDELDAMIERNELDTWMSDPVPNGETEDNIPF
jgi:hypothetical protein